MAITSNAICMSVTFVGCVMVALYEDVEHSFLRARSLSQEYKPLYVSPKQWLYKNENQQTPERKNTAEFACNDITATTTTRPQNIYSNKKWWRNGKKKIEHNLFEMPSKLVAFRIRFRICGVLCVELMGFHSYWFESFAYPSHHGCCFVLLSTLLELVVFLLLILLFFVFFFIFLSMCSCFCVCTGWLCLFSCPFSLALVRLVLQSCLLFQ